MNSLLRNVVIVASISVVLTLTASPVATREVLTILGLNGSKGVTAASLTLSPLFSSKPRIAVLSQQQPALPQQGCTQSASLEFGLSFSTPLTVPVVGFPINISSSTPTLVIKNVGPLPRCEGARRIPQKDWIWRLDVPPGSHSQLSNTDTLNVSFTPDRAGKYTVHLNGCGNHCTVRLVTGFDKKKAIIEEVPIEDGDREIAFDVPQQAQIPPRVIPPPHPSPVGEPATAPRDYREAKDFCGLKIPLGLGLSPQWFTTTKSETATPKLELIEGRVYESSVSRIDSPAGHLDNDVDVMLDVDPWLHNLLISDNPRDKGPLLPEGGMALEWEWPEWLEGFRPLIGDRISALGYHVIDCGHDITEIHPPIAVATHRALPVRLPASVSLEEGKPAVPIGSNIVVPGIITDIWVNLKGGDALECRGNSLRQSKLVNVVINGKAHPVAPCVPQPDQPGKPFTFHVYLPVNPQKIIKDVTHGDPPRPALFTQFVDHPETPAGTRRDISFRIVPEDSRLDGDQPYLTVSVDISNMRTGQTFAKRLISAWVYPDITGRNYGLEALRLRLNKLEVTATSDSFCCGDWRLWVGYPNSDRPWTRLITCTGCVDEKTYSASDSDSIFLPGALGRDGALKGEFLSFRDFRQIGRLRMTGYEQDTIGSDDVGEVDTTILSEPFDAPSVCKPLDETLEDKIVNSGCGAYKAHFITEAGKTPVSAVLSAQAKAFLDRLLVGEPLLTKAPPIVDSELFAGQVTAREVEGEPWQEAFKPGAMAREIATSIDPEAYVKDIRRHVLHVLGANPTPKHRAKVAADLQKLKPSIPAALYQKHLCDLETGRPCPQAQ